LVEVPTADGGGRRKADLEDRIPIANDDSDKRAPPARPFSPIAERLFLPFGRL
jgi:hypothetical protein